MSIIEINGKLKNLIYLDSSSMYKTDGSLLSLGSPILAGEAGIFNQYFLIMLIKQNTVVIYCEWYIIALKYLQCI